MLKDATDKDRIAAFENIYKIVKSIESMAFYDGHYLTFGLGAGSCRRTFCGQHKTCSALEGKSCRFGLLARPSMEAVGINVCKMTAAAGWDIYPIWSHANAEETPKAVLAGLVVVEWPIQSNSMLECLTNIVFESAEIDQGVHASGSHSLW